MVRSGDEMNIYFIISKFMFALKKSLFYCNFDDRTSLLSVSAPERNVVSKVLNWSLAFVHNSASLFTPAIDKNDLWNCSRVWLAKLNASTHGLTVAGGVATSRTATRQ